MHVHSTKTMFSPPYTSALQTFTTDYSLMWKWGVSKNCDVATGPTQTIPFPVPDFCLGTNQTKYLTYPGVACGEMVPHIPPGGDGGTFQGDPCPELGEGGKETRRTCTEVTS